MKVEISKKTEKPGKHKQTRKNSEKPQKNQEKSGKPQKNQKVVRTGNFAEIIAEGVVVYEIFAEGVGFSIKFRRRR